LPAGDADRALDYAVKAGDEAMKVFAYEQAADLYRLALETSDVLAPDPRRNAELLLALGRARAPG
jgi:hypothetical protein